MGSVDSGFFDDAYVRVLEPFHTEEEARYEVAAIREILGLAQSDRILDLGCGWARHLRLLDGAGHDVVGVDLSYPLLRQGRERASDRGGGAGSAARLRLVAGDMRRLPLRAGTFDVVVNLATSLGLFLDVGGQDRYGEEGGANNHQWLDQVNGFQTHRFRIGGKKSQRGQGR